MTSDSSDLGKDAKAFKLRSRKLFPIWKQKTISTASSKGYSKYLIEDVKVESETEIDNKEVEYINEANDALRRVRKGELAKMKRMKRKSLEAAVLLTNSVRSKDLKMLANCKQDPHKMFEKLCKKYGSEEDTNLTGLLEDFNECR